MNSEYDLEARRNWIEEINRQAVEERKQQMIEKAFEEETLRRKEFDLRKKTREENEARRQRPLPYLGQVHSFPFRGYGCMKQVYPPRGKLKNKYTEELPWYQPGSHFEQHHRSMADSILSKQSTTSPAAKCIKRAYFLVKCQHETHMMWEDCIHCHNIKTFWIVYRKSKSKWQSKKTRKLAYRHCRYQEKTALKQTNPLSLFTFTR